LKWEHTPLKTYRLVNLAQRGQNPAKNKHLPKCTTYTKTKTDKQVPKGRRDREEGGKTKRQMQSPRLRARREKSAGDPMPRARKKNAAEGSR